MVYKLMIRIDAFNMGDCLTDGLRLWRRSYDRDNRAFYNGIISVHVASAKECSLICLKVEISKAVGGS